ncbi:hypothetical protein ACOSJ1_CBNAJBGD_02666 [Enterococcus faecium]|nr:hypothetical protein ACOSJ1_CBNAJBGD_02666 [Enterococcus faecium]CAH2254237.1 hypothetical protein ACOSJ1_MOIKCCMD_02599 [Enterococcus faecium]
MAFYLLHNYMDFICLYYEFKKNNLEYNLCIFLAVIINLGLFIFSETILSKILLLIAIVLLVIPNFMQKKKRKNS